jgi:hypothetical protein
VTEHQLFYCCTKNRSGGGGQKRIRDSNAAFSERSKTRSTKHSVIASVPDSRQRRSKKRQTRAAHHSTKSTWADCVTQVTSTLGDVPFTLKLLKSELRSLALRKRQ